MVDWRAPGETVMGGEPVGESPEGAFCDFVFARSRSGSSVLPLDEVVAVARSSISRGELTSEGASTKPL